MMISGNTVPFALSEKNMNIHHDYFAIIVRSLSGKPPPSYPDHDSLGECANTFSAYFNDKIVEMRTKLEGANNQCPAPVAQCVKHVGFSHHLSHSTPHV